MQNWKGFLLAYNTFELYQGFQLLLHWNTCPDMEDVTTDLGIKLYYDGQRKVRGP